MNQEELLYIGGVWNDYFPRDVFIAQDPRLGGIAIFRDFFRSREGQCFIAVDELATQKYVYFNTIQLGEALPFDDFELSLIMRPTEVMGFIGIALSLIAHAENPHCHEAFIIRPRFYELSSESGFVDIKSSKVGQVVSVRGHVVRVSPCKPLVLSAQFLCAKCMSYTSAKFEDGIFLPPVICGTEKCYNKYLELDRSSVTTSDYQRVKLTELDEVAQQEVQGVHGSTDSTSAAAASIAAATARVPRTLEVEVRDSLVNTCVPGDLLSVVGIVKSVQMEAPRSAGGKGGYKESGLHVLYLLANSLLCLKSSGDRGNRHSRDMRAGARSTPAQSAEASSTEPLTLLDEQDPQCITQQATTTGAGGNSSNTGNTIRDSAFTEAELAAIRSLALSDQAFPLLVHSLCPTIFGQELVKAGLLLSLFGGSTYSARGRQNGGERSAAQSDTSSARTGRDFHVRPDIHVLVVGDPGLGKSQMLRAAATVAPRAVFVCGNTSTAAGLTVSVSRDASGGGKGGGELCIEAGALILADQGVCCIDELDKITADQHALLEAMEQQSVSIAKSGVVTSLKSRTSVLAAANPAGGHYNRKKSVCENLKMNAALLSRFDLIFILLDRPDERHDRMVGEHIMQMQHQPPVSSSTESHKRTRESWEGTDTTAAGSGRSEDDLMGGTLLQRLRRNIQSALHCHQHRGAGGGIVSVDLMRRYIEYARRFVQPSLTPGAAKVLQRLYLTMRAEASAGQSIPVTTRHLESLIRLSQARARIDLRDEVTASDAHDVVQLLQESLLDVYTDEVGAIDSSRKGGISLAKQVKALVKVMTRESALRGSNMFTRQEILALCQKLALDKEVDSLIDVMRTECYLLLKGPRTYQLQTA